MLRIAYLLAACCWLLLLACWPDGLMAYFALHFPALCRSCPAYYFVPPYRVPPRLSGYVRLVAAAAQDLGPSRTYGTHGTHGTHARMCPNYPTTQGSVYQRPKTPRPPAVMQSTRDPVIRPWSQQLSAAALSLSSLVTPSP